ncbi:hypothetical protein [Paenibacillus sp. 22594]|uniref:hypothetical protein n=1 Tax=Paenibacillus sp. 22594 TaxID=3453947 RepID=UPI003F82F159
MLAVRILLGFAVSLGGFPFRFGLLFLRFAFFFGPDAVDLAFFLLRCRSSLSGIVGFGCIQFVFPFAPQVVDFSNS